MKNLPANAGHVRDVGAIPQEDPLVRAWQPTPVFLPGWSHGQRSLGDTVHSVAKNLTPPKPLCTHACTLKQNGKEKELRQDRVGSQLAGTLSGQWGWSVHRRQTTLESRFVLRTMSNKSKACHQIRNLPWARLSLYTLAAASGCLVSPNTPEKYSSPRLITQIRGPLNEEPFLRTCRALKVYIVSSKHQSSTKQLVLQIYSGSYRQGKGWIFSKVENRCPRKKTQPKGIILGALNIQV